jgi:hypothetical protein
MISLENISIFPSPSSFHPVPCSIILV